MSYQLSVQDTSGYLHVQVAGKNTAEVVEGYVREVLRICASRSCLGLLVEENLTGPGLPLAQIYRVISDGSQTHLAQSLTVAFVNVNMEHPIGNVKFAETVARNRGVNLRAFQSVQDAQAWLQAVLSSTNAS